jgi:uncharacterized protein
MEYIFICLAAPISSGLTVFSGFGLGTILMPVKLGIAVLMILFASFEVVSGLKRVSLLLLPRAFYPVRSRQRLDLKTY